MNDSEYFLEWLARERLGEARMWAARSALVGSLQRQGPGLRTRLGLAIISVGRRVLGEVAPGWTGHPAGFTGREGT